jgi:hypothetical protein
MNIGFLFRKKSKHRILLEILKYMICNFRVDHLYTFFLRWNPECASDPGSDSHYPEDSNILSTPTNRPSPKHNEQSSAKGFVLLANDDPELSDDYISPKNKNNSSSKPRSSSDSNTEQKKQHYLKRQNTLLKEWEVRFSYPSESYDKIVE